jgi:hypothetical protein
MEAIFSVGGVNTYENREAKKNNFFSIFLLHADLRKTEAERIILDK